MTHRPQGKIVGIFIARDAGGPMLEMPEVTALAQRGLDGDRYCRGEGSFNRERVGRRQVTLINYHFFHGSGFEPVHSRRNLITHGIELMWLIDREFKVGKATLRGVKYCDPCRRPGRLADISTNFDQVFHDCGGLIAEVILGGLIRKDDPIVGPSKDY